MGKKIIVAEDDRMVSTILISKLEKENFEVILAEDGQEAIDKIKKEKPDLILSDLMMPFVSGLEVLEFVRNDQNSNIPFIILTSADQEELVNQSFSKGASDFLIKPFRPTEVILRIKKHLR